MYPGLRRRGIRRLTGLPYCMFRKSPSTLEARAFATSCRMRGGIKCAQALYHSGPCDGEAGGDCAEVASRS